VLDALRQADLILIGPGSLYTSIIPNLLVEQIAEIIRNSRAVRVYIANVMTQPGETDRYSIAEHIRAIYDHTKPGLFDYVVVNRAHVAPTLLRRYRREGAEPVEPRIEELERMGLKCITGDILHQDRVVRHDQDRLARLLIDKFVRGRLPR